MIGVASAFVFGYPVVMSFVWMVGGLYYFVRRERGQRPVEDPPPLVDLPPVSVLVPFRNESACVDETIRALLEQRYPDLEIVAVDDASTDDTGDRLDRLARSDPRVRVLHLTENQGKAVALRVAVAAARYEHLVCVDGDAVLDEYATHWMVWHLTSGPRVGAVTGNPRIRNRTTLLGRLQVGEFSSIVGLIKRSQRTYGRVFTVSGVICAFRRTALHRVGYWSESVMTEDIDISWRLQMDHWDVRYEPRALASIIMPETLRALWKQRLRCGTPPLRSSGRPRSRTPWSPRCRPGTWHGNGSRWTDGPTWWSASRSATGSAVPTTRSSRWPTWTGPCTSCR